MQTPPNACIDLPDERDYKFLEVFGTSEMPRKVDNSRTTVYNQGEDNVPSTRYACTCYGATHCVNEANAIEAENNAGKYREVQPLKIWKMAIDLGAEINKGWSLQGATNLVKNLGCISGYTMCRSLGEVKQALAHGQMIYTGSRKIDWTKTRKNKNIAVKGEAYGHAFMISGYDDDKELLKCRNSYGPEKYEKGYFYVRYKDFDVLYTCYAYTDAESKEIRNHQAKIRRELAVSRGIYNGQNDNDILIRQDASFMIDRIATRRPFWNGENKMLPVTRSEIKAMIRKATGKTLKFETGDPKGTITRGEAAEWMVRI